jgi:hypothetical protein
MSAVLSDVPKAPKPEIFDSIGYFDRRVVGADVKRWVFFALDLIVPQRKAEISWLQFGGEETSCPCLQKYGRGFVPRGLPALLEMGGEPIPMRHLGDLQAVAWQGIPLNEDAVKNKFGFIPVYPGDGLRVLRRYSLNDGGMRKGMDEVSSLQGRQWEECHTPDGTGILDVVERACYGDGMATTLKGLENQIRHAQINDSRIDSGRYKEETLKMCEESRNWAMRKIGDAHGLLKTGHVGEWQGGWTYSYAPITEMLLDQLEIPRQDQPMQELAKLFANQPVMQQPQGMSAADLDLIEQRMEARLAQAREADARRIAELEAKLSQQETPDAMWTCEHCGEEMKLTSKGFHIGRHCKVLHPKPE